ncbi:hypothetical protein LZ30DRAFT_733600 [Colletotrichum cereale]|nr:hypothetical protein LZ30DRAFT_733600 [Colletotrichum cereale]
MFLFLFDSPHVLVSGSPALLLPPLRGFHLLFFLSYCIFFSCEVAGGKGLPHPFLLASFGLGPFFPSKPLPHATRLVVRNKREVRIGTCCIVMGCSIYQIPLCYMTGWFLA